MLFAGSNIINNIIKVNTISDEKNYKKKIPEFIIKQPMPY